MVKINNKKIRIIKHGICYFTALVILFFVSYKNFSVSKTEYISSITPKPVVNNEQVSPKKLFLTSWNLIEKNYVDNKLNGQNWKLWKNHYLPHIKTEDDALVAINSIIASLNDPYSKFLSKTEYENQCNVIESKIKGIGINIASISGKIYIMNVLEGTPASNAGLERGDLIYEIDGVPTKGSTMFQVIQSIKGPLGTDVNITVLRDDKKISKKIKRSEINIKSVNYKILDNNIGYIQLKSFISKDLPVDIVSAIDKLKDTSALILDLRGNSGGLFKNAIFTANIFMKNGCIVNVLDNKNNLNSYSAEPEGFLYGAPIIVLVDDDSASASEILAGALKDNNRAKLVGTKTYGKGLVQKVYPLPNGTGLNLTVAKYITPNGDIIDKVGIEPNYEVNITKDDLLESKDSQLDFALNLLNSTSSPL